jgi:hypothetical protein
VMPASLYSDRLFLPCCGADALGRQTMWHRDSYSGYPAALGGSGRVLAVLLLDYPAVLSESGLVPKPLALGKG